MKASRRGLHDSQHQLRKDDATSINTPTRRRNHGARTHVTNIEDAGRLLEYSQLQRQLRFQHLVRRYLSQILHGCMSAYCTTPTCLSCNKRLVSRPFRPPTQLSARILAFHLASQDDPERGLCPHQLKVDPKSLEIEGAVGIYIRQDKGRAGRICDIFPKAAHVFQSSSKSSDDRKPKGPGDAARIMAAVSERRQTRKDPKSLAQNVFDTITMIFSYSKQIPDPASVVASLRLPLTEGQQSADMSAQDRPIAVPNSNSSHDSFNVSFTNHINGHAPSPTVNRPHMPAEPSPQNSVRHRRRPSKPDTLQIMSEVLSNGQHVHKVRHFPETRDIGHVLQKLSDPSLLDGTFEESNLNKHKMRSKNGFTGPLNSSNEESPALKLQDKSYQDHANVADNESLLKIPVNSRLTCDVMDQLKEQVYHHRNDQSSDPNVVVHFDTNGRFRLAKPFVNRSLFFTLSDPETLLKSFRDELHADFVDSPLPHLNSHRLTHTFRDWNRRNGALIFDSLWIALEALFRPPPELDTQKSPRLKPSLKDAGTPPNSDQVPSSFSHQSSSGRYLSDKDAAHIIMICIHALTSLVPNGWPHTWVQVRKFRGWGVVIPATPPQIDEYVHPWLSIVDELEYEPAIRLADRLLRGIGTRMCFEHILASLRARDGPHADIQQSETPRSLVTMLVRHLEVVERVAIAKKSKMKAYQDTSEDPGWTVTATFMEWLRTIVVKQWDGKAEINKWNSVGTAVGLLYKFCANVDSLNLRPQMFHIPYFNERVDVVQEPIAFLSWEERPNSFHIFQYPFLFPQEYLVGYFRTINFTNMFKQFESTVRAINLENRLDFLFREHTRGLIRAHLEVTLTDYLVLDVSREYPLRDTLDQLWKQERRMLLKPLKVRMGAHEGEVGLDQGGVTYEFFRLVLGEAFKPDTGMFTVDAQTRMIWFQPASLEPSWKFEMLGILFSLAVYNGITLPVTFPLVLYALFLQSPDTDLVFWEDCDVLEYLHDGWPLLARSFDELLKYDGDVAEDFMRDYAFSFEAFGHTIDVDMKAFPSVDQPWPSPRERPGRNGSGDTTLTQASRSQRLDLNDPAWVRPQGPLGRRSSLQTPLVDNANRKEFVKDYTMWLTGRSVERQLLPFVKGFRTCIDDKSLRLFTPRTLRALVEGDTKISIPLLRKAVRYEDGYSATHRTIIDFWSIVEQYSQEDRKRLLEFVTASERVPVTGFEGMNFSIVRSGVDTEMLPTSSTCFGKLMLPEYSDKEKMRRKLELAISNSKGFGVI